MQVPSFMHLSRYRCAIKFFEIFYLHVDPFEISFANAKGFAQCHHSIAFGVHDASFVSRYASLDDGLASSLYKFIHTEAHHWPCLSLSYAE